MSADYTLKAQIMREMPMLPVWTRRLSLAQYRLTINPDYQLNDIEVAAMEAVTSLSLLPDFDDWIREAERINHADRARSKRLQGSIDFLLSLGTCHFVTLTFSDVALASTSPETRRRYVTRFLKSQSDAYVANIDYGSENGREHYHAVVLAAEFDGQWWADHCGFFHAQPVRRAKDSVALSKYISKLKNHAIKETTKGSRAIYSDWMKLCAAAEKYRKDV